MITVEFQKQFDVTTKETTNNIYLRLYLSAFTSGLVSELSPANFKTLMVICSYMNEKGECYPTQRQIAERGGMSKTTVNKAINELLEFKINGKPILERELVINGTHKNSVYTVNPISQVAIFNGEVDTDVSTNVSTDNDTDTNTEDENKFSNAREVSGYFIKVYREVYSVAPNINYARDLSQVKKKWIGTFTDEQITRMIDVGVREYDSRWKNSKFPRPSLSALVSWIGEQALGISEDTEKEFKEVEEITSNSGEMNDVAISRLQDRLKK